MSDAFHALSIAEVLPDVFRWSAFSPAHKVELTSHAVKVGTELTVFDPIPLSEAGFAMLGSKGHISAIVLTNENHERDAARWSELCKAPIWAAEDAVLSLKGVGRFTRSQSSWQGWNLVSLEGGAGGETALRHPTRPLVVVGDAVVNLDGRTLELLPEKYCRNQALLKRSLATLVTKPIETLLMAHGNPLSPEASEKLKPLIA